jgi:hypothetical protein
MSWEECRMKSIVVHLLIGLFNHTFLSTYSIEWEGDYEW